jgi:hypothetical protein
VFPGLGGVSFRELLWGIREDQNLALLAQRVDRDTSPIKWLLHSNLELPQGNRRKQSRYGFQVAVEQLPVTAGELVEKKAPGKICHFQLASVRHSGRWTRRTLRCGGRQGSALRSDERAKDARP